MARAKHPVIAVMLAALLALAGAALAADAPVKYRDLTPEEKITADELYKEQTLKPALVVFDARDRSSFQNGHITGARPPVGEEFYKSYEMFRMNLLPEPPDLKLALKIAMTDVNRSTEIVTYCNVNCRASAVLLIDLKDLGFTNVRAMEQGFQVWEGKGYPVTIGSPTISTHALMEEALETRETQKKQ